ncbi:MAG: molybdopterin-dependent oxidoreductase [Chloroflexi bacterium]|nr:molybdopterin-dependent oxidoreductase [Chloroflexota bacterium]
MQNSLNRRDMIKGSVAWAALALARHPLTALGLNTPAADEVLVPFLDPQPPGKMLRWDQLRSWITANEDLFAVSHYGTPEVELSRWNLEIAGLVRHPKVWSLSEIKSRQRKEVTATLECSGNSSNPGFMGAIGNIKWTGTPLAPLLKECGLLDRAVEIVFFGADQKVEKIRDKDYEQNFARSLARGDALRGEILLAYEMNGEPLTQAHGAPLRLIVPGWFGIAWVKWLSRIEALDRRYMSKYMAREYVTIRGEEKEGRTIWRETSVGPMDVKSIVARVVRRQEGTLRISGAAWTDGTPLAKVELQIDNGPWTTVELDKRQHARYAWTFWHHDWKLAQPGEHKLVSRATDAEGRVQPSLDDPAIKLKRTYWEANQQWPRKIRL